MASAVRGRSKASPRRPPLPLKKGQVDDGNSKKRSWGIRPLVLALVSSGCYLGSFVFVAWSIRIAWSGGTTNLSCEELSLLTPLTTSFVTEDSTAASIATTATTTPLPSLQDLTASSIEKEHCPKGFKFIENIVSDQDRVDPRAQQIPLILHQWGPSRCVTSTYFDIMQNWRSLSSPFPYSYYLHDPEAVQRLLRSPAVVAQFPHLPELLKCVVSQAVLTDIWRYVLLWNYGGIFAHMDSSPAKDFDLLAMEHQDAYFIKAPWGVSHDFMALSPRHPLMYTAIQVALDNVWKNWVGDTIATVDPVRATGWNGALSPAIVEFVTPQQQDVPVGKLLVANVYTSGRDDPTTPTTRRSFQVVGSKEEPGQFVRQHTVDTTTRRQEYAKMGIADWEQEKTQWQEAEKTQNYKLCIPTLLQSWQNYVLPQ